MFISRLFSHWIYKSVAIIFTFYYRCHLAAPLFVNMPWSTSGSNKVWIFIKYYYECLEVQYIIIMITSQISLTTFFFFICRNQARSCFWTTKAGCVPSSESCCVWVTAGWWDWWEWKVCISLIVHFVWVFLIIESILTGGCHITYFHLFQS